MTGTEKLTQKALEQHDKIHPKLQASKTRSHSQSKEPPDINKAQPVRKPSLLGGRSESTRSSNGHVAQDPVPPRSFDRQGSRGSILAAPTRPKPGMSVFRVVAAARAWKRLSQRKIPPVPEKPKVTLENTYRVDPKPEEVFKPEKVRLAIKDILTSFLKRYNYSPDGSKQMSLILTNEIKAKVKAMNFPRYKVVCHVMMMQNKGQGSEVSSRCVWNPATDSFASYTHTTPQVICVGNVHAVYFE